MSRQTYMLQREGSARAEKDQKSMARLRIKPSGTEGKHHKLWELGVHQASQALSLSIDLRHPLALPHGTGHQLQGTFSCRKINVDKLKVTYTVT